MEESITSLPCTGSLQDRKKALRVYNRSDGEEYRVNEGIAGGRGLQTLAAGSDGARSLLTSGSGLLLGSLALDQVERRTLADPLDLISREAMRRLDRDLAPVSLADDDVDVGVEVAAQEGVETRSRDDVAGRDERVVGVVGKRQREDTLLGQVGPVDARKGPSMWFEDTSAEHSVPD